MMGNWGIGDRIYMWQSIWSPPPLFDATRKLAKHVSRISWGMVKHDTNDIVRIGAYIINSKKSLFYAGWVVMIWNWFLEVVSPSKSA